MTMKNFNKQIVLKSYAEIIAMTYNDAYAELNTYPDEYYNSLNSSWNIFIYDNPCVWVSQQYMEYWLYNWTNWSITPTPTKWATWLYYSNWAWYKN